MDQAVQPRMFVDGNNVMGSRPNGWWRDRAGAARRIVAEIALLAHNRKGVWTIVFDGPGPRGTEPSPEHLTVIHAGHGGRDSADDRIVELVGALPDRSMALVYTSDAALRARLHAMGAQVVGARALLRDHRHFGNDPRKGELNRRQRANLPPDDEFTMLFLDPPDHKRLRALVNKAFTPKAVNALEPHIRNLLGVLLDEIDDPAGFDLMQAVAQPLPVIVIAEMLGVPPEDRAQFKIWSDQRARTLEPVIDARERVASDAAAKALDAYFRPIIQERRAAPQDDIVSALAQAEEEGDRLTEREMLNMLRLLLIAGNETTTNLIGNGILALLRHPDQLQRLRDDPSLIPAAVDELLRFDSPVQTDFRRVLEDCEVNGFAVRRRDNIVVLLGAANRDPDVFDDPDRLDVGRGDRSHLSFGRGIHHCLGAPLAHLEGRIVLEMLLERFSQISLLDENPRFRNSIVLRGLESLPIRCVRA